MKRFTCIATENRYHKSYPAELTCSKLIGDTLDYEYVSDGAVRKNTIEGAQMLEKTAFDDKTICFFVQYVDKNGATVTQMWKLKDLKEIPVAEKKSK